MTVPKRGPLIVVLVLLVFVLIASLTTSQGSSSGGCYVFPGGSEDVYCVPDTLDSEAQADCSSHPGCSMSQHFLPGADCTTLPECQLVTCAVDCQQHYLGVCQNLGGTEVPEDQYNSYCSPGCCKIGNQFCQFGLNRFQCNDMAKKLGFPPPPSASANYLNPPGMTVAKCNQQLCQVQVTAGTVRILVQDQQGDPISNALVAVQGTPTQSLTSSDGRVEFPGLTPSTYVVAVSKDGFQSVSATISLSSGQTVDYTVTLPAGGTITVSGQTKHVVNGQSDPLSGVTISWSGPSTGQVFTDVAGNYNIISLVPGQYTITASKINFASQQQTLNVQGDTTQDFTLVPAQVQGVKGLTFIDFDGNGAANEVPSYGVKLYVDGNFRGYSQFDDGSFDFNVPAGEHTLTAISQLYTAEKSFTVAANQVTDLGAVLLTVYVGECSEGQPNEQKNVEQFFLQHVPGKKQVTLQWVKPCPEVASYSITKSVGNVVVNTVSISPAQNSHPDGDVEWGVTYTYGIEASYPTKKSASPNTQSITLGDKECEDHYHDLIGWDTFCLAGNTAIRKTVYTCSNENKLASVQNCAARDGGGETYFCSQLSSHQADCQDAGPCNLFADPFGLYYSRQSCYGAAEPAEAANFCYYDYSNSIVNQCNSCAALNSCFEYRSQDACSINNCLGTNCQWVNAAANTEPIIDYGILHLPGLTTEETGQGYCVPEKYQDDDQCSLCHPSATLFENYYCSAQVCSALGRCFANSELTACQPCGAVPKKDFNCYSYTTELECDGETAAQTNPFGEFVPSQDRCGWKRCAWQGAHDSFSPGSCVKDGDGDGQDDCIGFSSGVERQNCKIDVTPPRTNVVNTARLLSLASPNITFMGDDNQQQASQSNALGKVHYCILSVSGPSFCTAEDFHTSFTAYPGKQSQELATINLLSSPYLQKQINGETYRLKFYSTDKYHNQEELQETFLFVDNVPPQFEVNAKATTKADRTKLIAYLEGTNEPMGCEFAVTGLLPVESTQSRILAKEQVKKEVIYDNLAGIIYDLNVTCTDNQGNSNQGSKRLVFDQEERIDIIHPAMKSIVSTSEIPFRVTTAAGASCELYKTSTGEKVADFLSDEQGKVQETPLVPGFTEGQYQGEYKVLCRELLTPETYEDYFSFIVDFTSPATQVVLREGKRVEKPTGFGWEEFFIDSVNLDFECKADGFSCDKIYYCQGEQCYYLSNPNYKEYSSTLKLENSTEICYYSTDKGKTPVYSPLCGTVIIAGYGITLEKPKLHYFQEQQWGSSNQPGFPWQFLTKVPTQECRFDFLPTFSYAAVPNIKILSPTAEQRYLYAEFPNNTGASPYPESGGVKSVFVKCKNLDGDVGPQQKMNLEYDPSPPTITKAVAEPELLLEGTNVDLVVETDDKALCKYSNAGHDAYEAMNFAFPGAEADIQGANPSLPRILDVKHRKGFAVNTFTGLVKQFSLTTQCKNGAGDLSLVRAINFTVDYTQLGGITSVWPNGEYLSLTSVNVTAATTKTAVCEYRETGQYQLMEMTGEKLHQQPFTNLAEKYYQIPLRCTLGDHVVETASTFTIDRTPPVIQKVDDGNMTCGNRAIQVFVYTNEQNLSGYVYQLFDLGAETTFLKQNKASNLSKPLPATPPTGLPMLPVLNGTAGPQQPLEILTVNLTEAHKYKVRVQALDLVGLTSLPAESDGTVVVDANFSACKQATAPVIDIVLNESSSCTSIAAELHCQDAIGCSRIKYGQHSASTSCTASQSYAGQQIVFTTNGWLCYTAENYAGKNVSGSRLISFTDTDGDGSSDRIGCDLCLESKPGEVVDDKGCGEGQVPIMNRSIDFDKDGLPDDWEQIYNAADCPLDYLKADSNTNSVADGQEDYDQDGFGNYDEYLKQQDPCKKDVKELKPVEGEEGKPEKEEKSPVSFLVEKSYLPWILLFLGVLLIMGGSGYLIYYYKFQEKEGREGRTSSGILPSLLSAKEERGSGTVLEPWKKKLLEFKKARLAKEKTQRRKQVFGEFTAQSPVIPHIGAVVQNKAAQLPKLQQLAETYTAHKEEIKPGLRPEEKNVFNQLESIARKAKGGKIHDVASPEDAQTIFSKLKELAKKRKQ